jgi:hypothetical protein
MENGKGRRQRACLRFTSISHTTHRDRLRWRVTTFPRGKLFGDQRCGSLFRFFGFGREVVAFTGAEIKMFEVAEH